MIIRAFTSYLLTTTLLCQSILTTTISAMETQLTAVKSYKAPLNVSGYNNSESAVGILHYALHEGEIHVLLGSRDDNGELCNFGGGYDVDKDSNYAAAGSRESTEESMGTYSPHPRCLRHLPFIDLLTLKDEEILLYRMYWQRVNYVDASVLMKKLQAAQEGHSKEYTDFKWVRAGDLFNTVLFSPFENPVLESCGLKIYGPLFQTLSTPAGIKFLNELTYCRQLNRYRQNIRPFCNRLYVVGNEEEIDQPDYFLAPRSEDDILAEAVAAHGMAMVQLKHLFTTPPVPTAQKTEFWDPHCPETLSRIHLRIVLGPDYKEEFDFMGCGDPQRQADIENIKRYFTIDNDAEVMTKGNEFKRQITLEEGDYEFFADILEWETTKRQWPTFYHGASANINNLFKSFTYLRELMGLHSFKDLLALRGTDLYVKRDKKLWDMLARTGDVENTETASAMMFMNFVLFAGLKTTASTSASTEYSLNNHSVTDQDPKERFEEAMVLAGFSKPIYSYFQSVFEQYVKHKNLIYSNSVMLTIAQNPNDLDEQNYATGGGGHFYRPTKSSLEILKGIQGEYERQQREGIESFETNTASKVALIPENRLFLHPFHALNPKKIRMKAFDRFPLTAQEQLAYDVEMRRATVALLADWLAQHSAVMEGSFITFPALKKLYRMVYEQVTGAELQESVSHDGFIYLIKTGNVEAIQAYVDAYPEIKEGAVIDPEKLIRASLDTLKPECIQLMIDLFPACDTPKLVNERASNGCTPLFFAVIDNNVGMVKLFIKLGAEVNVKNDEGQTLLSTAFTSLSANRMNNNQQNMIEIVKLLLENGADVNEKDRLGVTPLISLISSRGVSESLIAPYVQLLLKYGADINMDTYATYPNSFAYPGWVIKYLPEAVLLKNLTVYPHSPFYGAILEYCLMNNDSNPELYDKFKPYFNGKAWRSIVEEHPELLPSKEVLQSSLALTNQNLDQLIPLLSSRYYVYDPHTGGVIEKWSGDSILKLMDLQPLLWKELILYPSANLTSTSDFVLKMIENHPEYFTPDSWFMDYLTESEVVYQQFLDCIMPYQPNFETTLITISSCPYLFDSFKKYLAQGGRDELLNRYFSRQYFEKIQSSSLFQDILFSGDDACAFIKENVGTTCVQQQKLLEDFLEAFPELVEKVQASITPEERQKILSDIINSNHNELVQGFSQSPRLQKIIFDSDDLLKVEITHPSYFDTLCQLCTDIPVSQARFKLTMEPDTYKNLVYEFFYDKPIQEIIDSPLMQEIMFSEDELLEMIKYSLGYRNESKIIVLLEAFPHLQEKLASYLTTYGHYNCLSDIEAWTDSPGEARWANYLGIVYQYGLGVSKDSSKALEWYTLAAEQGDTLAQEQLTKLQGL